MSMKQIVAILLFLAALGYMFWPLDIIPDTIPIVGWIDDLFVVLSGIFVLLKFGLH